MVTIASRVSLFLRSTPVPPRSQQVFRAQAESLDRVVDPRPLILEESLTLALQEQPARTGVHEHAETAPRLDQPLDDQLLVALEDRDRIDAVCGRDITHRRQGIALVEDTVEDHRDDAVTKLAVDGLTVVPLMLHSWLDPGFTFAVFRSAWVVTEPPAALVI